VRHRPPDVAAGGDGRWGRRRQRRLWWHMWHDAGGVTHVITVHLERPRSHAQSQNANLAMSVFLTTCFKHQSTRYKILSFHKALKVGGNIGHVMYILDINKEIVLVHKTQQTSGIYINKACIILLSSGIAPII
jgi:hypothetical protein